jgi:hypothetical protein
MKYCFGIIFVIVSLAALIEADLKVQSCPNVKRRAMVSKLSIADCTSYPCSLKRGTNATIKFSFRPMTRIRNIELKIAGIIQGRAVPFAVNDNQHCETAIVGERNCPLFRGKTYEYEFGMPVKEEYPTLSLYVRYELVDNAGRSLLCFQWPASIQ